jgi:phosphohistidine swiveling domain-containing protein
MTTVAQGQLVSGGPIEGTLAAADDLDQVLALMRRSDLEEVILLTATASATSVVPLLAKVRGIVCRSGGMTSHLAIVSREFGLPCIVGAEIDEPGALEGRRVRLGADGTVSIS